MGYVGKHGFMSVENELKMTAVCVFEAPRYAALS